MYFLALHEKLSNLCCPKLHINFIASIFLLSTPSLVLVECRAHSQFPLFLPTLFSFHITLCQHCTLGLLQCTSTHCYTVPECTVTVYYIALQYTVTLYNLWAPATLMGPLANLDVLIKLMLRNLAVDSNILLVTKKEIIHFYILFTIYLSTLCFLLQNNIKLA